MDRGDEHGSKGLRSCLEAISVRASISNVDIPMGASEQEIWNIFNIVLDQIRENDFVVFDITHAFRSIPMLAIVILNYAKVIKNIRLTGIIRAFEVLGPARTLYKWRLSNVWLRYLISRRLMNCLGGLWLWTDL